MEQTLAAWPLVARLLVAYFPRPALILIVQAWSRVAQRLLRSDWKTQCRTLSEDYNDDVLKELLG